MKLVRETPVFPNYPNKRSMLCVGSLYKLVALIVKDNERETSHPQNSEYVQISEIVK